MYGPGYAPGRAYGPRFLWSWPNSRISVMGGLQAAPGRAVHEAEDQGEHRVHLQVGQADAVHRAQLVVVFGDQVRPQGRARGGDLQQPRVPVVEPPGLPGQGEPIEHRFLSGGTSVAAAAPFASIALIAAAAPVSRDVADGGESRVLTRHATSVSAAPGATSTWSRAFTSARSENRPVSPRW